MFTLLVGLAVIAGVLWWAGYWPFDGSYGLPQRGQRKDTATKTTETPPSTPRGPTP